MTLVLKNVPHLFLYLFDDLIHLTPYDPLSYKTYHICSFTCLMTSGVARAFPGGRAAHPENQNKEENE